MSTEKWLRAYLKSNSMLMTASTGFDWYIGIMDMYRANGSQVWTRIDVNITRQTVARLLSNMRMWPKRFEWMSKYWQIGRTSSGTSNSFIISFFFVFILLSGIIRKMCCDWYIKTSFVHWIGTHLPHAVRSFLSFSYFFHWSGVEVWAFCGVCDDFGTTE